MSGLVRGLAGAAYVVGVGAAAAWGFVTGEPEPIIGAALVSLPASLLAMPAYYVAYGILALVPGANPSESSGRASCTVDGVCHGWRTGGPAEWFTATTEIIGTLALVAAATCNVVALGYLLWLRRRRRAAGSLL